MKLKNGISILLALLILLQSFSKVWIVISFKINQESIAQNQCINRDKPIMQCSGKCVLMKQMQADDDHDKKELPQKKKQLQEIVMYLEHLEPAFEMPIVAEHAPTSDYSYQQSFSSAFFKGIFHPPDTFSFQLV